MGKPLPSAARLRNFARIISSDRIDAPKQGKPISKAKVSHSISPEKSLPKVARVDPSQLGRRMENSAIRTRLPLSHVVSDCVRRWFQDTLKEAKAGDSGMQLLVGQMYNSGYGVRKDTDKVWIFSPLWFVHFWALDYQFHWRIIDKFIVPLLLDLYSW